MTFIKQGDPPELDFDRPTTARIFNCFYGGKDNAEADRYVHELFVHRHLWIVDAVRESRAFLMRAVRYLAAEAGIRQFVDVGVGLPTAPNTPEVALGIAPDSRIVLVDYDPMVMAHARALLFPGTADGVVGYIEDDVRDPERIIQALPEQGIDLSEPVALLFGAVLHELADADQPHAIVRKLVSALAPGSYLVLSHFTTDPDPGVAPDELAKLARKHHFGTFEARDHGQVEQFVADLDVVAPGIVSAGEWRLDLAPEKREPHPLASSMCYAAVARVP